MKIDTQAATVEAAAKAHAAETMRNKGDLWTRARIRAALETAFIAGRCGAQFAAADDDTVEASAELVAQLAPNPTHVHQNCHTCVCTESEVGPKVRR